MAFRGVFAFFVFVACLSPIYGARDAPQNDAEKNLPAIERTASFNETTLPLNGTGHDSALAQRQLRCGSWQCRYRTGVRYSGGTYRKTITSSAAKCCSKCLSGWFCYSYAWRSDTQECSLSTRRKGYFSSTNDYRYTSGYLWCRS